MAIEQDLLSVDGSGQTSLTDSLTSDFQPFRSPNGRKVAFRSSRDGNGEVYAINADGSGRTSLTNNPAGDSESPAGQ